MSKTNSEHSTARRLDLEGLICLRNLVSDRLQQVRMLNETLWIQPYRDRLAALDKYIAARPQARRPNNQPA